jgi:hypothetical protein
MYEGDSGSGKPGLKEICFYDHSMDSQNGKEAEKRQISVIDEVFHPLYFYRERLPIDKFTSTEFYDSVSLYGQCSLCGSEVSLTMSEEKLNEISETYPLGVLDYGGEFAGLGNGVILKSVTCAQLAVKVKGLDRVSLVQDVGGLGHFNSYDHKFKVQKMEELNACAGRPRLGLSGRHWRLAGKVGRNFLELKGKRHYFDGTVVVPFPCEEGVRDFVGADYGAMALQAMHWVCSQQSAGRCRRILRTACSLGRVVSFVRPDQLGFQQPAGAGV